MTVGRLYYAVVGSVGRVSTAVCRFFSDNISKKYEQCWNF